MEQVKDKNGKTYALRELDPGDHLDLAELAGPQSTNDGYMRRAAITFMVMSIDGVPLPVATDRRSLRANAKQIGNDGMSAILDALFPPKKEGDDAAPVVDDTAKN